MAADKRKRTKTSRRSYLKLTGAATLSTAFVGTGAAAPSDLEDQYGTVVDVTDEGADPNGNESITPIIERLAEDDTLLKFPAGEYYVDKRIRVTGCNNLGIVGDGATLVPAPFDEFDDSGDWNYNLFRLGVGYDPVTDLRFENFTVDMTADDTGVRVIDATADDGLVVRDIDVVGRHDSGAWGPGRFDITSPDGSGIVERFTAPDGAEPVENTPGDKLEWGPTGIICNTNKGTMTFRDCVLGSFPDNGLYATDGTGSIRVEGGRFENSFGANVRVGGNDSYVHDATIVVDQSEGSDRAQLGLKFENGEMLVAENVDVRTNVPTNHAVVIDSNADRSHINDSSITVQADETTYAVFVKSGSGRAFVQRCDITHEAGSGSAVKINEGGGGVKLWDTTVTGQAPAAGTYSAIYNERDDGLFLDLSVDHGNDSGRHGLYNVGSNCTVRGGAYVSQSHAVVEGGDGTLIDGITARTRSDASGLQITESAGSVTVRDSQIEDGVRDDR
ncbi:hypothetical protein [Halomicrococcus sp. SG-WS-1]|uniref:hypothetical protein n=1 Tax=Halomicrococcus sp. SG-WS-1 TaxID=3439057 RepID=UPI003F796474